MTKAQLIEELNEHPERFSPNVILRPLYQEFILPNLAYIGGGGELAYWLERKKQFVHFDVFFPMLIRRNSALWITQKQLKKAKRWIDHPLELFQTKDRIIREALAREVL